MFNNPLRIFTLATMVAAVMGGEWAAVNLLGGTNLIAFWIVFVEAVIGSAMVAALDPTFGTGYLYPIALTIIIVGVALMMNSDAFLKGSVLLGVCSFAGTGLTYGIRRLLNRRRHAFGR